MFVLIRIAARFYSAGQISSAGRTSDLGVQFVENTRLVVAETEHIWHGTSAIIQEFRKAAAKVEGEERSRKRRDTTLSYNVSLLLSVLIDMSVQHCKHSTSVS